MISLFFQGGPPADPEEEERKKKQKQDTGGHIGGILILIFGHQSILNIDILCPKSNSIINDLESNPGLVFEINIR
jgi:hypothetical protein